MHPILRSLHNSYVLCILTWSTVYVQRYVFKCMLLQWCLSCTHPLAHHLQALPGNRALRGRVISFLHRMVECLGERLLPTLPAALAALLPAAADAGEVGDVAALLQQLAARFRAALLPLLAKACPHMPCPFLIPLEG